MRGYKATVDSPVCDLYRELYLLYPGTAFLSLTYPSLLKLPSEAKYILNTRDTPAMWWTSFTSTIAQSLYWRYRILTFPIPFLREQCTLALAIVNKWDTQGGGYSPQKYINHLQEVKEFIPKEKLLEFNVKQGWEPLCKFLEVEVPKEPFPHLNDTKEINAAFFGAQVMGGCVWIVGLAVVAGASWLAMTPPTFVKDLVTRFW